MNAFQTDGPNHELGGRAIFEDFGPRAGNTHLARSTATKLATISSGPPTVAHPKTFLRGHKAVSNALKYRSQK